MFSESNWNATGHRSDEQEVLPMDVACQAPLSMEFSRQEYFDGLPCLSPRDIPNLVIEPRSSALQAYALPSELLRKHKEMYV